jgi:hypothetical protein
MSRDRDSYVEEMCRVIGSTNRRIVSGHVVGGRHQSVQRTSVVLIWFFVSRYASPSVRVNFAR